MSVIRFGIRYYSMSGNTESVANYIAERLDDAGHSVNCAPIYQDINLDKVDCFLLGTPTIGDGEVPDAMMEYVMSLPSLEGLPVGVFGTGDTQWGNSFCLAVDKVTSEVWMGKMAKYLPTLKIEQNLFMKSQKDKTDEYIENILGAIMGDG